MTTYGNTYGDPTLSGTGAQDTASGAGDSTKDKAQATAGAAHDAARQTAGTAREQAGAVAETAKAKTGEVAQTAKEQASAVIDETKAQAADVLGQVREQANSQALAQRDRATSSLRSISDELRGMVNGEGGQSGMATTAAEQISTQMESLAGYLEQREPGDLINEVRSFARQRPGAFLLGAVVAGVVAGRMFKGATSDTQDSGTSHGPGYSAGDTSYGSPSLPAVGADAYGTGYGYDSPAPHGDPMVALPDTGYSVHGQSAMGSRSPSTGPLAESAFNDQRDEFGTSSLEDTYTGRSTP